MEDYRSWLDLKGRGRTGRSAAQALQQFHRWTEAEDIDPLEATPAQLDDWQAYLVTEYRSPNGRQLAKSTASARLSYLKGWYRWCVERGHIAIDPSRGIGLRVQRSRQVHRDHLTQQEATALVQAQAQVVMDAKDGTHTHAEGIRNLAAICLALATGRRIGGLLSITVDDVNLERRELRVEREKGRVGRVLPVAAWAMDVVHIYIRDARSLLTRGNDAPWLFLNAEGDGPMTRDALRWMLKHLVQRTVDTNPDLEELAHKTISWHSLRVSFATMLFSNGCDIRSVNELLLHRNLSTTARYTPIPIEDLRRVFRTAHPRP